MKHWYRSRTFWFGVALATSGALNELSQVVGDSQWLNLALSVSGLVVMALRKGTKDPIG